MTQDFESEDTGLNLFDEQASAAGNFPTSVLGYDRHSVDSYVREVEGKVGQLQSRVREQRREIDYVKAEIGSSEFTRLGAFATGLLRAAEAQAKDIVDRAEHEAERIKTEARRSGAEVRRMAHEEADDIRITGLASLRQLRQEQADAGEAALGEARRAAAETLAEAAARAKVQLEASGSQAAALLESARVECARMTQEAQHKASIISAEASAEAERSLAKASEAARAGEEALAEQARQAAENTARAAEETQAIHDRNAVLVQDAIENAEHIKLSAIREAESTIAAARARAQAAHETVEQELAWRKEQLAREVASLESRKSSVLAQLNNLRALAEQSKADYGSEDTMTLEV